MLTSELILPFLTSSTEEIYIAYSGGMDSHVLLHLAATASFKSKVTAVYINHGLQKEANQWAEHCQAVSLALGLNFQCLTVKAQNRKRQSPEEAARDARYAALKPLLKPNDVLLLGQHQEDQLETVLLQLFRGAGVQGLSGMPGSTTFGRGTMCRPLLEISKQAIEKYAHDYALCWIDDPSNRDNDFDRNFLRNDIVPQIKQRWPGLDKTVARSARHCASTHHIVQKMVRGHLRKILNLSDNTLNINRLLKLEINMQSLVIRQWFRHLQLKMPSEKCLNTLLNEVIPARQSGNPEIRGAGYIIKPYKNKLYSLNPSESSNKGKAVKWPKGKNQLVLEGGQKLCLVEAEAGVSKNLWKNAQISVQFRKSAEKIKLPGRSVRQTLKKLYQEQNIPPWERNDIPLIYINGQLAVVVGLWISSDFICSGNEVSYQIQRKERIENHIET